MAGVIESTGSALLTNLLTVWYGAFNAIPGIIGAIVLLVVGYVVAWALSYVLEHVLERIKLDQWVVHQTHVGKMAGKLRLAHLFGTLTRWFVFILFLPSAAGMLGSSIAPLADFLAIIALWIPRAIGAILIAFFGTIAAEYVHWKVLALESSKSHIISDSAKVVIYVLTILVVLVSSGLTLLASNALLIILSGVMFGLALAFGIAGLGMKGTAEKIVKSVRKKL